MAKRTTKAEAQGIAWLIIIGLPIFLVYHLGEAIGWPWFLLGMAVIAGWYFWYSSSQAKAREAELRRQESERIRLEQEREQRRRSELLQKYGDEKIVEAIMRQSYWQGQTAEQLRESLGSPVDIDEKVLKTKRKEIWKYRHMGGSRFGLRITLEQGEVVGWDEKI